MARSIFEQRGSALEDEFFHRVDQQLIAQLQAEYRLEAEVTALEKATGIVDRHVLEELRRVEITPRTLAAFSLFPAVFVAWSDGHVESAERDAILKAARHQGIFSVSPTHELLASWLDRKPHAKLVSAWKEFIHAVRPVVSDAAFREMRQAAIARAEEIAKAAGGFLGIAAVSRAEKSALAELNEVFDHALAAAAPAEFVHE